VLLRQEEAGGKFLLAGARYRYTKALWITGLADRLLARKFRPLN